MKREGEMRAGASLFLRCCRGPIVLVRPPVVIGGSNNPPTPIALFFSINLNNNSNSNSNDIHIYPHHYHHRQSYSCSSSPLFFSSSIPSSQNQNQTISESEEETSGDLQEEESESAESECDNSSNNDASDVFRRWGCSEEQLGLIQQRRPALLRMKPSSLESKLHILRGLGILPPDLIRIVTCRPRFLFSRIGRGLEFLRTLFPSSDSDLLRKAILRNPSLLNYKVEETMRPCVHLYESMGISRYDLGRLLISRPTIIPRSSLSPDKLDLICRTPLRPSSPLYKYAVSIVAISRIETIHAKIANLQKFGFSFDQVMSLFARSPNVLTLSVDKVQRNMTYILGIINLPPSSVLHEPLLLYANLDTHLKPRYLLGLKLQEMGLRPQITGLGPSPSPSPSLFKALRMKEPRFLKAFILCHKDKEVTESLMEFYTSVKVSRRLAESCRKVVHKGFPF